MFSVLNTGDRVLLKTYSVRHSLTADDNARTKSQRKRICQRNQIFQEATFLGIDPTDGLHEFKIKSSKVSEYIGKELVNFRVGPLP